jgi:hypothetical protein
MRGLLVLVLVMTPWTAWAASPLEEAEALVTDMEYATALQKAEQLLRSPEAGPVELVAGWRIHGLCLSALNREAEAVESFRRLLAIDPSFRLPSEVSPKLRSAYYKAVGMSVDQKPIQVSHVPPVVTGRLGGLRLQARLEADPLRMVKGLRLRYRIAGGVREISVLADKPKGFSFKLPDGYSAEVFEYWFEAFNEYGGVLARSGSPDAPLQLRAAAAPEPAPVVVAASPIAPVAPPPGEADQDAGRWYTSWWFWTVVGVVVAGAVTGGVLATSLDSEPDPLRWQVETR